MALFHRVKQPDGTFTMIEMPVEDVAAAQLRQPSVVAPSKPKATKKFSCTVCDAKFAGQGVMSMHFGKKHPDLVEDKDSWRKYVEKLED